MSNNTYDILKYIAQIVLPAIATLYGALAGIWGLPYGEQIVATISAIDLFLGAILKISTTRYEAISIAELRDFEDYREEEDHAKD